jgi:hypothetical protein
MHQLILTKDLAALCLHRISSFISFKVFRPLNIPKEDHVTYETLNYQVALQQLAQELWYRTSSVNAQIHFSIMRLMPLRAGLSLGRPGPSMIRQIFLPHLREKLDEPNDLEGDSNLPFPGAGVSIALARGGRWR